MFLKHFSDTSSVSNIFLFLLLHILLDLTIPLDQGTKSCTSSSELHGAFSNFTVLHNRGLLKCSHKKHDVTQHVRTYIIKGANSEYNERPLHLRHLRQHHFI